MTETLALIRTSEAEAVVSVFPETAGRIDLPGVGQVSPPVDGWEGDGYRIAAISPNGIPSGKQQVSSGVDGVELIDGDPMWILEDTPPGPPVSEVSAAQAKLALDAATILDDVEAMIAAHPVRAVRIWFADANAWERSHPYVSALGAEMSLDDDAIDGLFAAASLY
jgi:hypothetical protein